MILERHTIHVSDDAGRIAMLEKRIIGTDDSRPTLTRYVYSNHLQSASLELDENAAIVSYEEIELARFANTKKINKTFRWQYHPYGTTAFQAKSATINAVAKRYRYTGKERDEESACTIMEPGIISPGCVGGPRLILWRVSMQVGHLIIM